MSILTEYDRQWEHSHRRAVAKDALILLVLEHGYKESALYDLVDEAVEEAES